MDLITNDNDGNPQILLCFEARTADEREAAYLVFEELGLFPSADELDSETEFVLGNHDPTRCGHVLVDADSIPDSPTALDTIVNGSSQALSAAGIKPGYLIAVGAMKNRAGDARTVFQGYIAGTSEAVPPLLRLVPYQATPRNKN